MNREARIHIGPFKSEQPIDRNGKFPRMIGGRICVGVRRLPLLPGAEPEKIFLSPRQQTILKDLADNETTIAIGFKYKISEKTVQYHRDALQKKLGIQGIAALTKVAVKIGLTTLEEIAT